MIPFASHDPRPKMQVSSSEEEINGGTVSMWVERTISGRGWPGTVAKDVGALAFNRHLARFETTATEFVAEKISDCTSFGVMDSMSTQAAV